MINERLTRIDPRAPIAGIQIIGSRNCDYDRFGHAIIYFPTCAATDDDYPGAIAGNKLNLRICFLVDLESRNSKIKQNFGIFLATNIISEVKQNK